MQFSFENNCRDPRLLWRNEMKYCTLTLPAILVPRVLSYPAKQRWEPNVSNFLSIWLANWRQYHFWQANHRPYSNPGTQLGPRTRISCLFGAEAEVLVSSAFCVFQCRFEAIWACHFCLNSLCFISPSYFRRFHSRRYEGRDCREQVS